MITVMITLLLLMVMMMTTHDNSDGNIAIVDGHGDST